MSAVAAAAVASGVIGAVKFGSGLAQTSKGNRLAKNNIFQNEQMPGQVQEATNLAAQNYYGGMPGQSAAQQRIGQNAANSFYNGSQGASSGGDLLDLAGKLDQNTNVATNDLATQAAAYKSSALSGYTGALNNEAGWQDKLYKNNTLDPYLRTANTAAAMYGAGKINEFSGLDQVATAGITYGTDQSSNAQYNDLLKKYPDLATQLASAKLNKRGR